jgi:PAS domain S-box-containing protein
VGPSLRQAVDLLPILSVILSGLVLLGYVSGDPLLAHSRFVPMALPTAVSCGLLGSALLLSAWAESTLAPSAGTFSSQRRLSRGLLIILLLAISGLWGFGAMFLRTRVRAARHLAEEELDTVADLKARQISNWYKERLQDCDLVFRQGLLKNHLIQYLDHPSHAAEGSEILGWMEGVCQDTYRHVALVDAAGQVRLLASAKGPRAPFRIDPEDLQRIRDTPRVTIKDLHFAANQDGILMEFWIPLTGRAGFSGALCLEVDANRDLFPFIQTWLGASTSGETLLVRREGQAVVYLNELRHQKGTALKLRFPLDPTLGIPAVEAALGREGLVQSQDYRGIPVIAALRQVAGTPWAMVAKKDTDEVSGPIYREILLLGSVLVGLTLMVALGAGLLIQQREAALSRESLALERQRHALAVRFEQFMRQANDIILVHGRDGRVLEANPRALKAYGYTLQELVGLPFEALAAPQNRPESADWLAACLRQGDERLETVHRRKDGNLFPIDISAKVVEIEGDVIVFSVARDITERRRMEDQLAARQAELEAANKILVERNAELDEFTYVASHDLQEPLRKLVSFSELLPRDLPGELPERAAKDLHFIVDAGRRMQAMVQDLLALSRAGKGAMKLDPLELETCLKEVITLLDRRIKEAGASIEWDPLPVVKADRSMVTRLIMNLLGNALKFKHPGVSPRIRITAEREGQTWVLGVQDNGIGIEARYFDQIFAPFRRLHTRGVFEGSGIGLSVCRKIVERHQGKLWVESEPGKGSWFRFTLPSIEPQQ